MMIPPHRSERSPTTRQTRVVAEFLLLAIVVFSPWPLGSVEPQWQFVLSGVVFALLAVWATHTVLTRRFSSQLDSVLVCLIGLVLITAIQLVPFPEALVRFISPTTAELHRTLIPDTPELLPGEQESAVAVRSNWLRFSLAPAETEYFLAQLLTILLVYSCARNFVSSGVALRRLAWVGLGTGVLLAVAALVRTLGSAPDAQGSTGFGPFGNKNHFAFQVLLFAGLGIGLFMHEARERGVRTPQAIGTLAAIGLMFAAVAFSRSRGGVLAAFGATGLTALVAYSVRSNREHRRLGLVLIAGVAAVSIALTVWLGWHGVIQRIATLWSGDADNRSADWRVGLTLAGRFPATGVGGGALSTTEPLVRTRPDQPYEYNTLDNEYLEALVEGGPVRFALTLTLACAAVWIVFAGYRRLADRSTGPILLGCGFGLTAVALHSVVDFGLHIPSIALTACIVTGYAVASCSSRQTQGPPESPPKAAVAYTAAGVLVLSGLILVLVFWRSERVARLQTAAANVLASDSSGRWATAINYLEVATQLRPNDASIWRDLSMARFQAAAELQTRSLGAVSGPVAFAYPPQTPPALDPDGHIAAGLRAARTARGLQPTLREPHLQLGLFVDRFARSEPAASHFNRAKIVAGFDPDVWYSSGLAAASRGDWAQALADWRESLLRSPRQLAGVCRVAAASGIPPEQLRTEGLPDDPELWFNATGFLFSNPRDPERQKWLLTTANRFASSPEPKTPAGFSSWATTLQELGDSPGELRIRHRAATVFPSHIPTRERLVACLESQELYAEAVAELEWLISQQPENADFRERLAAAKHSIQLLADIDRK